MADLKTNYVDDKLDTSKNQLRKYNMITNDDGTVSFVDVTTYTTQGTSFGAKDVNDTNAAINQLNLKKQDASTAITTSNIGKQSVNYANSSNYANSAGSANSAAIANKTTATYNGNPSPICPSLSNSQVQFLWNTSVKRVDVYVDKTYIGHIVTN